MRADIWIVSETAGILRRKITTPIRLTSGPLHFPAVVAAREGKRLLVIGTQPRGEIFRYDPRSRDFTPYDRGLWGHNFAFSRNREWFA
jgi:hypothetical protein